MSDNVPFGKYRGRPVEEMLEDATYMAWLEAQPWFREKFAHLRTAKEQDALSRTPVHNKLQTMFLDPEYRSAFIETAAGYELSRLLEECEAAKASCIRTFTNASAQFLADAAKTEGRAKEEDTAAEKASDDDSFMGTSEQYRERAVSLRKHVKTAQDRALKCDAGAAEITATPVTWRSSVTFESSGANVLLTCVANIPAIVYCGYNPGGVPEISAATREIKIPIEIKPSVADEYPAVLRQMNRNKSEYLFVGTYEGEGATERQFVLIFKASGKTVVFKRDVDAVASRRRG